MMEYIAPKGKLYEEMHLAQELFSKNGPVSITHEHKPQELAVDYLLRAGCPPEICYTLFNAQSEWIFPYYEVDIEQSSPEQLADQMLEVTTPVYEAAQYSLAAINDFGYNDHGPNHIRSVTYRALAMAKEIGLSEEQQKIIVIAGIGHDLGNLINRDIHSLVSPSVLSQIFPSITEDVNRWRSIKKAIQFHNSGVFNKYIHPEYGRWAFLPIEQQIANIKNQFGIESVVVALADKLDVGRWRVNEKARNKKAIDQHQYSEFNLHNETMNFLMKPEHVEWNIVFNPYIFDSEKSKFSKLAVPNEFADSGYVSYASEKIRDYETGVVDFHKSATQLVQKHELFITVLAGFAVNQDAEKFILHMYNPMPPRDQIQIVIDKNQMVQKIKELKEFSI